VSDLPDLEKLSAQTDRARLEFLEWDLRLCGTFADVAKTEREFGDRPAAHRALEKAEIGYSTLLRLSAYLRNIDRKLEIEQRLAELRTRLDGENNLLAGVR
jgi:hypothetical protein